jgi:hypothetical protein
VIAALAIGFGVYQAFTENALTQLFTAKEKIEQQKGVINVIEVKTGTTTYRHNNGPSQTYTFVKIIVRIDNKNEATDTNSKYFDEFNDIIKSQIPESRKVDRIIITLYYGYSIGIASKTRSVTKTFNR